jgi:hypothetical protein
MVGMGIGVFQQKRERSPGRSHRVAKPKLNSTWRRSLYGSGQALPQLFKSLAAQVGVCEKQNLTHFDLRHQIVIVVRRFGHVLVRSLNAGSARNPLRSWSRWPVS